MENKAVEKWTEVLGCLEFLAWWSHLFNCIWFLSLLCVETSRATPGGLPKIKWLLTTILHFISIDFAPSLNKLKSYYCLEKCPCLIKIDSITWTHLTLSDIDWRPRQKLLPKQKSDSTQWWKLHEKESHNFDSNDKPNFSNKLMRRRRCISAARRATRIEFPAKNVLILNVLKGLLSLIRQIEYLFQWRQRKRCKCILDIFMDEGQTMESYLWCSFSHFIWEKRRDDERLRFGKARSS